MKFSFHKLLITTYFLVGIFSTLILIINGLGYYSLPVEERFFSLQHVSLKPSGNVGHGLGIVGSLMMIVGVSVYMLRKRVKIFFNIGYLKHWLEFHIFLCTVGPVLVLFHTAFKFGGIVAVSFWSMVVVVLSGFVGRFIYVQIPHTIQGKEIDIKELTESEEEITARLLNEYNIDESFLLYIREVSNTGKYLRLSLFRSFITIITDYFTFRKILSEIKKNLLTEGLSDRKRIKEITGVLKNKFILTRRIGMLRTMQKMFRYWHIFHLPFALSMFIIMIIHIAVTVAFGYRWIF
ncbi:MAG: hypothetical protein C4539_04280 [Ignavibacteriales bacterium]|nr:MAG: hypothetical protein C4539_04280 [Ignavibacteriales bacterium]